MTKVSHFLFDCLLLSTFLSSTKRIGGFEYNLKVIENNTLEKLLKNYLALGDLLIDTSINQLKKYPNLIIFNKNDPNKDNSKRKWF